MQIRHTLFKNLLKCICHTELPVHDHRMPVPHSHPDRLYHLAVSAGGNGTQIMLVVIDILRGNFLALLIFLVILLLYLVFLLFSPTFPAKLHISLVFP